MITTNVSEQFGNFIKAAAREFNFATSDEQAAVKFICEWPDVAKILQDYPRIRAEVKGNRKSIGHDIAVWNHYRNELEIDLISPAHELRTLCELFFRSAGHETISSVDIDSSYFGQEISPLQRVAADVETTMQRLVISVEQELYRHQIIKREQQVGAYHDEEIQPKEAVKTNKFNAMSLKEVRSWFMQLADNNSSNGKPFLTTSQVEEFIERAFFGNTEIPAITPNVANREKGKIIGLFHLYFQRCLEHQTGVGKIDPNSTSEKYIQLLTDNLDIWTFREVKNNFRRAGNWKKPPQ